MVNAVRLRSCGIRTPRLAGVLSLGLVWLCGCGTSTPNPSASVPSGGSSTSAGVVSSGPQLGLVWNPGDATLRPLNGVAGSAQVGTPLFPAGSYATAAYSAPNQTALLVDKSGNLQVLALPSSQPSAIAQGVASAATIAFSPHGSYAAVYAPGATSLLLISGLPQQPIVATVNAGGALRGAGVSDAGTLAMATTASAASISVTTIASGGARSVLASLGGFGGLAFLPGSEDLLLSDAVANTLLRIHSGSATTVATHADGLNQPLAVAVSQDDHWAVTANRADGTLVRVDLTGTSPSARSTCVCSPSEVLPLYGNAEFELTTPGKSAAWMIEADDAVSRVLFIPPARSGQ